MTLPKMTESQLLAFYTIYPRHHADGTTDKRYSIRPEYCGYDTPRYVLRYCGDYIDAFLSIPHATLRAVNHHNIMMGNPVIEEVRA